MAAAAVSVAAFLAGTVEQQSDVPATSHPGLEVNPGLP